MKKFLIFLSCMLISALAFFSCGRDVPSESEDDTVPEIAEITENIETTESTEPLTEESTSTFDMDKTLENTYLCGVQLASNLTLGMLGEDFSLDSEHSYSYPDSGKIICDVNYKGLYIGQFYFQGSETIEGITSDTVIESIIIDTKDIESFDVPVISVNGLTMNSTHEELYSALGNDYEIGVDDGQIKYLENGKIRYLFGFREIDGIDKLAYVLIKFK